MSKRAFEWGALLQTEAPSACTLQAGLFTTYDRADERLLVEHLLPMLLKLGREFEGSGEPGHPYFVLELDKRLKDMHGKLVVISSTMRDEDGTVEVDSPYGWIWQSIRHLTVGHQGAAVQHAKLWMLHWQDSDQSSTQYLEIIVSSANLTMDALKGQLQGTWKACIRLQKTATKTRLDGWGIVPHFLRELAKSAGDNDRLAYFIDLLKRAECPPGIGFLASVPGHHSRQALQKTPWGAAGLAHISPLGRGKAKVSVLSPFVGTWNAKSLSQWCGRIDSTPDRLNLVWITAHHPWSKNWVLPHSTFDTLMAQKATLSRLPSTPDERSESGAFHVQHRPADPRWSHAKVYALQRGNSQRLLVTSANFSTSAWGRESANGTLNIKNFELGVSIDQGQWPFSMLEVFDEDDVPATVAVAPSSAAALILWASAVRNSKGITIKCRCAENCVLTGEILGDGSAMKVSRWTHEEPTLRVAKLVWAAKLETPATVQLDCNGELLTLAVFDERSAISRTDSPPPGISADLAQDIRDELLFEQYGGPAAEDDSAGADSNNSSPPENQKLSGDTGESSEPTNQIDPESTPDESSRGTADSYAVPEFVLARSYFDILDNWSAKHARLQRQEQAGFEQELLRHDGWKLVGAFKRRSTRGSSVAGSGSIGAELAAQELTQRLKHYSEAPCPL